MTGGIMLLAVAFLMLAFIGGLAIIKWAFPGVFYT